MNEQLSKIKTLLKRLTYLTVFLILSIFALAFAVFRNGNSELNSSIELTKKIHSQLTTQKESYDSVLGKLDSLESFIYSSHFELQDIALLIDYTKGSIKRQLHRQKTELVTLIEAYNSLKTDSDSIQVKANYFPTLN